jgi:hypothetical protein
MNLIFLLFALHQNMWLEAGTEKNIVIAHNSLVSAVARRRKSVE